MAVAKNISAADVLHYFKARLGNDAATMKMITSFVEFTQARHKAGASAATDDDDGQQFGDYEGQQQAGDDDNESGQQAGGDDDGQQFGDDSQQSGDDDNEQQPGDDDDDDGFQAFSDDEDEAPARKAKPAAKQPARGGRRSMIADDEQQAGDDGDNAPEGITFEALGVTEKSMNRVLTQLKGMKLSEVAADVKEAFGLVLNKAPNDLMRQQYAAIIAADRALKKIDIDDLKKLAADHEVKAPRIAKNADDEDVAHAYLTALLAAAYQNSAAAD